MYKNCSLRPPRFSNLLSRRMSFYWEIQHKVQKIEELFHSDLLLLFYYTEAERI